MVNMLLLIVCVGKYLLHCCTAAKSSDPDSDKSIRCADTCDAATC